MKRVILIINGKSYKIMVYNEINEEMEMFLLKHYQSKMGNQNK